MYIDIPIPSGEFGAAIVIFILFLIVQRFLP